MIEEFNTRFNKDMEIVAEQADIVAFIMPAHLPPDMQGWGNSYVGVPHKHPWYAQDYDTINVEIHGGLTYGQYTYVKESVMWVVGFDTAHCDDNLNIWPKERLIEETKYLFQQALESRNKE